MTQLDRDGAAVGFVGGGTELGLGSRPAKLDAVIQTGQLNRVVEYAPADLIVTVEAGIRLSALQAMLHEKRQRLALDPPLPERATLGGIIAANSFGPRRTRFGSVRDLLIGISIIRADGKLARAGGKVVKNVAGFDLPKLMCGSLGSLGLIASATFRLHPLPEVESTVREPALTASQVRSLAKRIRDVQLEPSSLVALSNDGRQFEVLIRFEGFAAGANEQCERLIEVQRQEGGSPVPLDDEASSQAWEAHDRARTNGELRLKVAAPPTAIESLDASPLLRSLEQPRFVWYAALGLGFISGTPRDLDATGRALEDLRNRVRGPGGSLVIQAASSELRSRTDPWGPAADAVLLMRRVKQRFDPEGRLNAGRLVGGI
jgi:glycolate oxidase FAD binding subunit